MTVNKKTILSMGTKRKKVVSPINHYMSDTDFLSFCCLKIISQVFMQQSYLYFCKLYLDEDAEGEGGEDDDDEEVEDEEVGLEAVYKENLDVSLIHKLVYIFFYTYVFQIWYS